MRARTIRVRPLPLAVLALALASVLGGCGSSGPAADGPLSSASSRHGTIPNGSDCVPGGRPQTFGDQVFTNYGNVTLILDRVALLRPQHQRLIGSYAVPGGQVIGTVFWPPKYAHMPPGWKHRRPVHGFRLAPGRAFDLVLGVVATIPGRATSRGMLVYYHDSSGTYVAKNDFQNIIAPVSQHGCR